MDITPILAKGAQRINAYGAGEFKVNDQSFNHPIIVTPSHVEEWKDAAIDESIISQLSICEILLIGSGVKGEFLPPNLRAKIKEKSKAGVEVMDTGAACRTYNVLLAEGRQVIAFLLPV